MSNADTTSRYERGLIVRGTEVPEFIRDRGALEKIDYIDAFAAPTTISATPEQWARAMLGYTPDFGERFIWTGLLGLKLDPAKSPDRVAGWSIAERADNSRHLDR